MSGRLGAAAEGKLLAATVDRKAFMGESLASCSSCGTSEVAVWLAFQAGGFTRGFFGGWKTGSAEVIVIAISLLAALVLGEDGAIHSPGGCCW